MPNATTVLTIPPAPSLETAWEDVHSSFERFCLTAGIGAQQMLREDADGLPDRATAAIVSAPAGAGALPKGKIGFHGGKVDVRRPRVRSLAGHEVSAAELADGAVRGLARPVGDEPDAD